MNQLIDLAISFEMQNQTVQIHPTLLVSDNDVVLIDCGYPGFLPLIEDAMRKQGVEPSRLTKVVITHHDHDHMGALHEIKEKYPHVKVVASEIDSEYIAGRKKSLRLVQAEQLLETMPDEQKQFGIDFCKRLRKVKPVEVDLLIKDGDHFDWAGGCEIVATPGHMPGHISLYVENYNAIITGDAAYVDQGEFKLANPQYTLDMVVAQQSLDKLLEKHADTYYCFHGGIYKAK